MDSSFIHHTIGIRGQIVMPLPHVFMYEYHTALRLLVIHYGIRCMGIVDVQAVNLPLAAWAPNIQTCGEGFAETVCPALPNLKHAAIAYEAAQAERVAGFHQRPEMPTE